MITPSFNLTATERVLPKLTIDFTSANLDSRITFTRAGNTATVINSSGQIVAINADLPRFDYTVITGGTCKGLLIEQQTTNLALNSVLNYTAGAAPDLWSPGFTNGARTSQASTITNTGNSFTQTLSAAGREWIQFTFAAAANTTYTFSVYVEAINPGASNAPSFVYFASVPGGSSGLTEISNPSVGRASCSVTIGATAGNVTLRLGLGTKANINPASVTWSCPQIEASAFPTSYIPTTTTTVTRNADVATMTGTNFSDWYSAGAGGVVARVLPSTVSGTRPALQFDDATADEVITLRGNTTNPELVIVDGGSPQAQIDAGTIAANTAYNLGAAWNTNNCAAAVNGGAAVTDTTATIPTVTQARLGSDGTNYLNGHLQTLRYWPQRIINAEVQAFSK